MTKDGLGTVDKAMPRNETQVRRAAAHRAGGHDSGKPPEPPPPVSNPQSFRIAMKHAAFAIGVLAFATCTSMSLAADVPSGREYHVSPQGNDANDGSAANMLKTISAAARLAQPGDVITVHEGVYRERITPPRGGQSDTKRIVYQAAPGEKVEIKGSEVVKHWTKSPGRHVEGHAPQCVFRQVQSLQRPHPRRLVLSPGPPASHRRRLSERRLG